jgi:Fic family protein
VWQEHSQRVDGKLGRLAPSSLLVQEALQSKPLATVTELTKTTKLTAPNVTLVLRELERLGIVQEITGRARGRIYSYARFLKALEMDV